MQKSASRRESPIPERVKRIQPYRRFCPEAEEDLTRLVGAATQRTIRVRYLSANPASLVSQNTLASEKARASLVEEPTLRADTLRGIRDGSLPAILAYRNNNGDLCSFDDYLKLAVACDAEIDEVRVVVLGEGNEWLKTKNQAPTVREA